MESKKNFSVYNIILTVLIFLIAGLGLFSLIFSFANVTYPVGGDYHESYTGYSVLFKSTDYEGFYFSQQEYNSHTLKILHNRLFIFSLLYFISTILMLGYLAYSVYANRNDIEALLKSNLPKFICAISFVFVLFGFLYAWSFTEAALNHVWTEEATGALIEASIGFYVPIIIDVVLVAAYFIMTGVLTRRDARK